MRVLISLVGSVAFAFVLSDMWGRAIVPIGAVQIPPFSWFGLLLIGGLFRVAFLSDSKIIALGKESDAMDDAEKTAVAVMRFLALFFSYGIFRMVEWISLAVSR